MLKTVLKPHHSAIRRVRQNASDAMGKVVELGYAGARRTPMPDAVRDGLRERIVWRRELVTVPIGALLLGGQNRDRATDIATASGDLLWGSTRVADGPHAALLALAAERGAALSDAEVLDSAYAAMARTCIALSGQYFSAVDDDGIVQVSRGWVDRVLDRAGDTHRPPHATGPGVPVRVAPVRGSDCYQVVDGHHRVAEAAWRGEETVRVQVDRMAVDTPLTDLLNRMTWIGGAREKYQPLEAPELATWPTVRACTDRLRKMQDVALAEGIVPEQGSYLDVASCYGWFVDQMARSGYAAEGLERDPLAPELGHAVYGMARARITTGDAVDVLGRTQQRWDVVSCFSLLHHFALGRADIDAVGLVRLLDKVTGRVLVLDTGQAHEAWFAESLSEWDTDHVMEFLGRHTTFDRILDLGPDDDDREPYSGNYGRHLIACIRDV